ncbi:MAG TPA: hypothetical protein VKC56_07980 [Gallionellaceae bacterium]|nr:hypothetical protein [Gallionellaceae bacterium]
MHTMNPLNTQRAVELDVTLEVDPPQDRQLRKKTSAVIGNLPTSPSGGRETQSITLSFAEDFHRDIRIGVAATVAPGGEMLGIHLVIFEGDFCFGRGSAWLPLRQTISVAVARKDDAFSVDCYVTYRGTASDDQRAFDSRVAPAG